MIRRLGSIAAAVLVVALAAARCGDDGDGVTNPLPPAPGSPTATATPPPAPGNPTPTPPPSPATAVVDVGSGGGFTFRDRQSGTSATTIPVGTTVQWIWVADQHSTTSGTCPGGGGCQPDGLWDSGVGTGITFSRSFDQPGTFPYFCTVHGAMMQGTVIVQ